MIITKIHVPSFKSLYIEGELSDEDKLAIYELKRSIPYDDYAVYNQWCARKYRKIKNIVNKYPKPTIILV